MTAWRVLAVDDEPLALDELMHRLRQDPRVGVVSGAFNGVEALRMLHGTRFDAVFLDVNMPQLDGVELAAVLSGLKRRPEIVFVTAHDSRAAEAYTLDAVDYVLKPLRAERVKHALDRVERRIAAGVVHEPPAPDDDLAAIRIDDGRRTFFVRRDDVLYAESHGDYVHLHTVGANGGIHIVRIPLSALEAKWREHGFLRVHRSYLVALRHVTELARDPMGGQLVRVSGHDLPVSRRLAGALRERIVATASRGHRSARS